MMMTEPMASNHIYRKGTNITLTCSAESSPPAMIMWMIDDMHLNLSGPQLHLQDVTGINSANYTCLFYNTVTLRFSSASMMISIMGKVEFLLPKRVNSLVLWLCFTFNNFHQSFWGTCLLYLLSCREFILGIDTTRCDLYSKLFEWHLCKNHKEKQRVAVYVSDCFLVGVFLKSCCPKAVARKPAETCWFLFVINKCRFCYVPALSVFRHF